MRTRLAGWVACVLCSPALWALDGTVLVTTGDAFQQGDLALIDAATGTKTVLLTGGNVFGPCFSPDGKQIAYWQAGTIYTMNNDGSNITQITTTFSR